MYEWDEEHKKVEFGHNPFSMPQGGLEALNDASNDEEYLAIKAFQYDLVCNGYELGSGAIRNHRPDIMFKAFEIAGYGPEVVEEKFGGMLNAFRYGAPPHGGCALGLEPHCDAACGSGKHSRSHYVPDESASGRSIAWRANRSCA